MRVLVACEESGTVRDALRARGIDAVSCDLQPTSAPGPHIQGDVRQILHSEQWAGIIAHPPCTHTAVSGARYFEQKRKDGRQKAAIEHPVSIMSTVYRKPDQVIQPWQFGHGETKATCLWLKGLPPLKPTIIVSGREARIWKMPPGPERAKLRSKTYQGIADAMAEQWRPYLLAKMT